MYKKLFSTSIINALTASINILSSYFIVRFLSLETFGEFSILSSYLSFGGLVFAIIQGNFSIFKYQDDRDYKTTLISFFLIVSVLFFFVVAGMSMLDLFSVNFWQVFLFGLTTYFLGYFDIKYQALGKLNTYFIMLFTIAALKVIILFGVYSLGYLNSISEVLSAITVAQGITILIFLRKDQKEIILIFTRPSQFYKTTIFIKQNIKIFSPYYLNTILKRIRANSIVLTFSFFFSKELIGLFSVFVKITSFVFGLSRNLEAFFMNRDNIQKHKELFYSKSIYFILSLQFIYIAVGLSYLKIFVYKYYFWEILFLSLLVYPHVFFLLARSEMLSNFRNLEANVSETIYVSIVLILSGISYYFGFQNIHAILVAFFLATLGLQLYMIFSFKRIR